MTKFTSENIAQIRCIVREETQDIREDISVLKTDVAELKTDVAQLKTDVAELKTDVAELKTDVAELKTDVAELKTDVCGLKADGLSLRELIHRQGILAEDTNKKIDIMLEILTATTKKSEKIDPLEEQVGELQDDHKILKHTVTIHIADKDLHRS